MELQIAYVLFVDIVGYSKLLLNEQRRLRGLLNEMVRGTEQFRTAEEKGRLIKPSPRRWNGAGVYQSREAPVECARISNATAKNGAAARDRWLVAESFRPHLILLLGFRCEILVLLLALLRVRRKPVAAGATPCRRRESAPSPRRRPCEARA